METRAAVAHAAGQPLAIETIQLEGPRAGAYLFDGCIAMACTLSASPDNTPKVAWAKESTGFACSSAQNTDCRKPKTRFRSNTGRFATVVLLVSFRCTKHDVSPFRNQYVIDQISLWTDQKKWGDL